MKNIPNTPNAAVQVRLDGTIFKLVEDWRRGHEKIPARSDAFRELLSLGLEASRRRAAGGGPTKHEQPTT
jgi:hypothetical protein